MSGSVWHWGRHAWLYAELLHALQGEYLLDLGSQQRGTFISVSPQYPIAGKSRSKRPMSLGQSGDRLIP